MLNVRDADSGTYRRALRPLRTPLHTKRSKRCPVCTHILIKPEQKSSSTRFKIKLVASNYLPAIDVYRRAPTTIGSRLGGSSASSRRPANRSTGSALLKDDIEPLRPGRTYTFDLGFANPLYEPIHVRLAIARPRATVKQGEDGPGSPPYAVNLPTAYFPIAAYAEEWEYEMDEDDGVEDESGEGDSGVGLSRRSKLVSKYGPGIVERKMNKTTVMLEVAVARDAVGPLGVSEVASMKMISAGSCSDSDILCFEQVNMLVTYYYQSDDSAAPPSPTKSPVKGGALKDDRKSFSFWTFFTLGEYSHPPFGRRPSLNINRWHCLQQGPLCLDLRRVRRVVGDHPLSHREKAVLLCITPERNTADHCKMSADTQLRGNAEPHCELGPLLVSCSRS